MLKTPFHQYHTSKAARMVDFAGWDMPLLYDSIIKEHHHCRNEASVFDVSHMGRLYFNGVGTRKFLERVLTRLVTDMKTGQARYSLVCNTQGGVMDDVLVYRFEDKWMVVCNASNREKITAHFQSVIDDEGYKTKMVDKTESTAMLAVQGPKVIDLIGKISREIPALANYGFCEKNLMVLKMMVSRTGYTGEDGVEVILSGKAAPMAVKLLLETGEAKEIIKPAGLGARDTLRIEAGMPLYGHELGEDINPYEVGLGFAVCLEKGNAINDMEVPRFIGQDALETVKANGRERRLIGLKMQGRRTPRQGFEVRVNGEAIGTITSACTSPTLEQPIAIALVKSGKTEAGQTAEVVFNGGKCETAEICSHIFYKRQK